MQVLSACSNHVVNLGKVNINKQHNPVPGRLSSFTFLDVHSTLLLYLCVVVPYFATSLKGNYGLS